MQAIDRYRRPSVVRLVQHIVETPELVRGVRELSPEVVGKLIDAVGLEDAGALVGLASTEQLARVFDEDLWIGEAGEETRFDAKRFSLWLEILFEAGERAVVERLCELPLDFVILCVQRLVLVLDIDSLAVEMAESGEDGDAIEKALDSQLFEEWEEFRLIARDASAWEAVWNALIALDREHHDVLRRILERCAAMSSEYIAENGGLYEVLTSDEMLESDLRAERDDRRAERGYVAPSDAKSFLALCRQEPGADTERDPVTRAYFRELRPEQPLRPMSANARQLTQLLERTGIASEGALPKITGRVESRKLAQTATPARSPAGRALDAAMLELATREPAVYRERLEELGYLSNVLISGLASGGRRLRPIEAIELALSACERGLELGLAERAPNEKRANLATSTGLLRERHLEQLFRLGWRTSEAELLSEPRAQSTLPSRLER
jgi:hypothetical protein